MAIAVRREKHEFKNTAAGKERRLVLLRHEADVVGRHASDGYARKGLHEHGLVVPVGFREHGLVLLVVEAPAVLLDGRVLRVTPRREVDELPEVETVVARSFTDEKALWRREPAAVQPA